LAHRSGFLSTPSASAYWRTAAIVRGAQLAHRQIREWRDAYSYDRSGRLLGWNRFRGGAASRFTRDGDRVVDIDSLGRPIKGERVRYQLTPRSDGHLEVVEVPTGTFVTYSYKDDNDPTGVATQTSGG
jgi:hypothetical protein